MTNLEKTKTKELAPWQNALVKAEGKFLSITDPIRTKTELGFAAQIFQGNEMLQKCDSDSIMNAVINIARTSITINPIMKLAYLIPRGGKCVLDFSYVGLVKMLKDNGCISYIEAFVVYKDEEFNYDIVNGIINHKPYYAQTEEEQKKRVSIGAYSRAILPDKSVVYCYMPMWEVDKVKNTSKAGSSSYSPWNTWLEEMIKKTVIKRHFKMLIAGSPSQELQEALKIEEENNGINFKEQAEKKNKSAIEGIFSEKVEEAEIIIETSTPESTETKKPKKGEQTSII
jgi:recombination protein RecT